MEVHLSDNDQQLSDNDHYQYTVRSRVNDAGAGKLTLCDSPVRFTAFVIMNKCSEYRIAAQQSFAEGKLTTYKLRGGQGGGEQWWVQISGE